MTGQGAHGIGAVLPVGVTWADTRTLRAGTGLFPDEEAVVARAVQSRRREFAEVRGCARQALAELGIEPRPILPGAFGAPMWPAGVVGSMTHCAGYAAAAVARADRFAALGIDAEPHEPLPDRVVDLILTRDEHRAITGSAPPGLALHWDRVAFSAKESIYKAWSVLTGGWLDFTDVHLILGPEAGTFTGHVPAPGTVVDGIRVETVHGRWAVLEGLVLTAAAVTRHPPS